MAASIRKTQRIKHTRKRRKLTFQILSVIFVLFEVLTVVIIVLTYQSAIGGFLKSQNATTENLLNEIRHNEFLDHITPDRVKQESFYISEWIKNPEQLRKKLTPEETDMFYPSIDAANDNERWTYDWLKKLPEDLKNFCLKTRYNSLEFGFSIAFEEIKEYSYSQLFCINITEPCAGMILTEYNKESTPHQVGEYFNRDIMQSPAIQKIINSGSEEIVFERVKDFPEPGNYYVGYKPVRFGGELYAVIGITYKWDAVRTQQLKNMQKAIIAAVSGLIIILVILYIIIYRQAVKPVSDIKAALIGYTDDKNSAKIVKHMYDIKANNEIGYLADVISDLALEIDLYTKENVRIATERERAEKELYEAEVQIMVSQIRPHFMYNALTSIAMMCDIDPKTAKEATIHFSKYLRCNMDALKQTAPVPFEKELEHLKHYLYIEKLRFDDLLNVEYDIQTTGFEVPLLSIQPLVENAVKHGVGMAEDGGTVKITALETEDAYEVIIADDGVGFDPEAPKKDDGRSHIGMETTKKRLKDLCDADVIITSKPGEGTVVRVVIPKKHREESES